MPAAQHPLSIDENLIGEASASLRGLMDAAADHPADLAESQRCTRDRYDPDFAELIIASASVQRKLRTKFGEGWWLGDERSVAQSTCRPIAKLKSRWLPSGSQTAQKPQDEAAIDACCGIGGDALELANGRDLLIVDQNPQMLTAATWNLLQAGRRDFTTQLGDVSRLIPTAGALHIDPDRRSGNRRTTQVDCFEPNWETVAQLIESRSAAIVKLAPATELPELALPHHRAWISMSSSVREQTLLIGQSIELAGLQIGSRSAWVIREGDLVAMFEAPLQTGSISTTRLSDYLIDPDRAIRAAGLTECFADRYDLQCLGGPAGFLTSDSIDFDPPLATCGRVIWSGSPKDRTLRKELKSRDLYASVVKVRGGDHDPALLQRRYRETGTQPATLWIGRMGKKVFAALTSL